MKHLDLAWGHQHQLGHHQYCCCHGDIWMPQLVQGCQQHLVHHGDDDTCHRHTFKVASCGIWKPFEGWQTSCCRDVILLAAASCTSWRLVDVKLRADFFAIQKYEPRVLFVWCTTQQRNKDWPLCSLFLTSISVWPPLCLGRERSVGSWFSWFQHKCKKIPTFSYAWLELLKCSF